MASRQKRQQPIKVTEFSTVPAECDKPSPSSDRIHATFTGSVSEEVDLFVVEVDGRRASGHDSFDCALFFAL